MFSLPRRLRAKLFDYRYEPLTEKSAERVPDGDTKWIDVSSSPRGCVR
jgi:hypothetical protein